MPCGTRAACNMPLRFADRRGAARLQLFFCCHHLESGMRRWPHQPSEAAPVMKVVVDGIELTRGYQAERDGSPQGEHAVPVPSLFPRLTVLQSCAQGAHLGGKLASARGRMDRVALSGSRSVALSRCCPRRTSIPRRMSGSGCFAGRSRTEGQILQCA